MASKDIVLTALENPNYQWRTIEGIVKETSLPLDDVEQCLRDLNDQVVSVVSAGRTLYTTRDHYQKKESLLNRTISAFSDRVK
jgi:hypothetical protein